MTVEDAITGRRSIRKFKNDTVSHKIIEHILDTARWSPSWGNTQPWEFYVLTGNALEEFRKANHDKIVSGEAFASDVPIPEIWPDHMKKRYGEIGKILLSALGIAREDKEARNTFYEEMARLFGAPCLIIACIPRASAVEYALLDIGLIVQSICLLAHEKGLGTCIMAAAIGYPELLRSIASIPDEESLVLGAIRIGRLDYIKRFSENGFDLRFRQDLPFFEACRHGRLDIIKYLAEHEGADIHALDYESFLSACNNGHLDVVKYLVENGADDIIVIHP